MNRLSTSRTLSAACLVVAALGLVGCPNAGLAPPLPGDGAFTPAPVQAAGSVAPGTSGTSTPAPDGPASEASDAPSTAPPTPRPALTPAASGKTTILQGTVRDERGATVDGATVVLRSLDAGSPYEVTVTTRDGNFVANGVPEGVQIQVTATKAGWTRRTRTLALQASSSTKNVLNFGSASGVADANDGAGGAFFLSNYPELIAAAPDAATTKGEKLAYTLTFSEPLDDDNRARVEEAFSLNHKPVAEALMPDGLTALEKASRVVFSKGSSFRDGRARLTFAWNKAGDSATVSLDAPLRRLDDAEVLYTMQLVRPEGEDAIEDGAGNVLGMIEPASGQGYFAVRKSNLTLADTDTTAELRWQATHQRTASFETAQDRVSPVLQSVSVSNRLRTDYGNAEFYQFELKFSEAMRVYPDEKGYGAELVDLGNYVLAMSDSKLDGVDLSKGTPGSFDAATQDAAAFEAAYVSSQASFQFVADAAPGTKSATDVFVEPSDDDPTRVNLFVPKAKLPTGLKHVKVLVKKAVTDPAGNTVSEANAKTSDNTADNVAQGLF